jgi:murein DD-endopeptidase MepM/ murein hydrolase activator NlpD
MSNDNAKWVMVNYSGLRLRAAPGLDSTIKGHARARQIYQATGEATEDGYLWVRNEDGLWLAKTRLSDGYQYASDIDMTEFTFEVWPTQERRITQGFARNPKWYNKYGLPGHEGVDIAASMGSEIYAVADGQVIRARREETGHNYGKHVKITHSGGYVTTYAHLQKVHVNTGDSVVAGDIVGLADSTGNSFGSHLHLSLQKRPGLPGWPYNITDPTPFLRKFPGVKWPK